MKALTIYILIISAFSLNAQDSLRKNDLAPDFSAKCFNGDSLILSECKNGVVMLQFVSKCNRKQNFWLTKSEKEIWQKLKNEKFIAICITNGKKAEKTIRKSGISYTIIADHNKMIWQTYGVTPGKYPEIFIIDRGGQIIYKAELQNSDQFNKIKNVIHDEVFPK